MTCCGSHSVDDLVKDRSEVRPHGDNILDVKEQEFIAQSRPLPGGLMQSTLVAPDMHCVACITKIEKALRALPFVEKARANLSLRQVMVVWNPATGRGMKICETLDGLGFTNYPFEQANRVDEDIAARGKRLLLALAVAGFATANIMLLSVSVWSGASAETAELFHLLSGLIAVPAVAIAGRPFFSSALLALAGRRLNMDVPISLAVLLALGMGFFETLHGGSEAYFDACVMLLFFLLIGRYLDHLMREKARSSVQSLARLTSKGGLLVSQDGGLEFISLDDIGVGQRLRVLPGERFPVNGTILTGSSELDRSLVTGESVSVQAQPGSQVEAGVLNLTGPVDILTTSDAKTSFVAEIMKMIQVAENGRGAYVRVAERAAQFYAPAVHLLALITFIGWMFLSSGEWKSSLYAAIAVLIITCPCALGLAVPVVHVIGANRLLKRGILMRDGSAFERLAEIDHIAFDKTGTLTMGEPALAEETALPERLSRLIRALSESSSHPVSKALRVRFSGVPSLSISDVTEVPGFGVEAEFNSRKIRLGRAPWVFEITPEETTAKAKERGSTAFAVESEDPVFFSFHDRLRADAREAIGHLAHEELSLEILSGDSREAVAEVAGQIGVQKATAEMTPSQKVERIQRLGAEGKKLLMVGDGLNDAPALAAAHVSMAPASASEMGRQASDFVFTQSSLLAVPFALHIARRTRSLIRQNFAIAIVYNVIAVPLAMMGHVTPLIAALAMSFSSILVVANSMRLNFGGQEIWQLSTAQKQSDQSPGNSISQTRQAGEFVHA